ncbi:hypothetical protein ONZ51_g11230 [Trametes cubensis]|uniref:F-box domain-containing protein n=1 Tax=Trametes cubensis TaxID=1111947 RepID=A0AAD7X484_9APHY|nr:hypothetical protein ONZ51_g11230 [Trametes cubensis]
MLFRTCVVVQKVPIKEAFLPDTLWPHIQNLVLRDVCPDWYAAVVRRRLPDPTTYPPMHYTQDPLLCGIFDGTTLGSALRAMPKLRSVTVWCGEDTDHGLPWHVLQVILTLPHLHDFSCHHYRFSPTADPSDGLVLDAPLPLTSFRYKLNAYRPVPRAHDPEKDALSVFLKACHAALEVLWLPTESTPFHTMLSLEWPSLRELRLRGEFTWDGDPLVFALRNMPKLRLLKLDFALLRDTPRPIWPENHTASYSWPELIDLQVSFPCIDDQLYAHLTPTLRRLSLRFFPHRIIDSWCTQWKRNWRFPSPSAEQLRDILRHCCCPDLKHLEVKYHQDGYEQHLIKDIASLFPSLKSLKILRYCQEGAADLDMEKFGRLLRPLTALRELSLHLDLEITPYPVEDVAFGMYMFPHGSAQELEEALRKIADVLARNLPSSVGVIKFLQPWMTEDYKWTVYNIIRGENGEVQPHAEYDVVQNLGTDASTTHCDTGRHMDMLIALEQ